MPNTRITSHSPNPRARESRARATSGRGPGLRSLSIYEIAKLRGVNDPFPFFWQLLLISCGDSAGAYPPQDTALAMLFRNARNSSNQPLEVPRHYYCRLLATIFQRVMEELNSVGELKSFIIERQKRHTDGDIDNWRRDLADAWRLHLEKPIDKEDKNTTNRTRLYGEVCNDFTVRPSFLVSCP